MEYRNSMKYSCLIILGLCTFIIYFVLTNQDTSVLKSLNIPLILGYTTINVSSTEISINNETKVNFTFESRLSDYYPRLPIHIYTQNVSLIGNTSKLILIGNGFFGDRNWGIVKRNRSSREIMTSLYCPFLSNHCDITTDLNRSSEADAIVYHMRDGFDKNQANKNRHPNQRFVFALWESPAHTPNLQAYNHFFNWTMTYRLKSHIMTTYFFQTAYIHTSSQFYQLISHENSTRNLNYKIRKVDHRPSNEILDKKKLGTAAALISNCGGSSHRLAFISALKRYTDVKVYGRCGQACPSNINCRKFIAQNYYFILSFENSLCSDYTTEKFFSALEYPVVPVVLGRTNYSHFIPSSGYIDINQFSTMQSLAKFLNETRDNKEKYLSYFSWKENYVWGLEHFFTPFCDLCLRLHLDSKSNVIDNMQKWWFDGACQTAHILP